MLPSPLEAEGCTKADTCSVGPSICKTNANKNNQKIWDDSLGALKDKEVSGKIGCGGRIRTYDLQVMSLTSYRAAPPRANFLQCMQH